MKALIIDEDNITVAVNGKATAKNIKDYLSKKDHKAFENEAYKFFLNIPKLHPRLKQYFDYNEMNLLDFVEEEFCFKSVLSYSIKDVTMAIGAISKVIAAEKPNKIIVKDNVSIKNKAAVMVAKNKKLNVKVKSSGAIKRLRGLKTKFLTAGYENYLSLQKYKRMMFKKTKKNSKGILFLPYYANHADVMNPVIKLLRKKKQNFDVVCVDNIFNVTKKRLNRYGISYEIFEHCTNRKVKGIVKVHKKDFRKRWKKLLKDKEVQKTISYKSMNLWNLLKPRFNFLFKRRFVQVSEYIETTRHLISIKKPSIVVIANDTSTYGRVASVVANFEELPCLTVQHGAIADYPKYNRIFAEFMAVEGPKVKKFFVEKGMPQKKFIITGQPRYDLLARKEGISKEEEMRRKLGIKKGKKVVVLATQVPECDEKTVSAVYEAVKDMDNVVLVVKMHPAERTDKMYQRLKREAGIKNVIIGKDIHLYGLLNISELMMTVYSTTALEAMMLNKPVITINLTGAPDMMPYASSGAALGVYKVKDLKKAIESVLRNKKTQKKLKAKRDKFIHGLVYKMDGKASERVVKLIQKLRKK